MKVGILTHPLRHNYGGVLQAYALQRYLKDRGHDVYMIYQKNDIPNHFTSKLKCIAGNCLYKLVRRDELPSMLKETLLQERFNSFINGNFDKYISSDDIKEDKIKIDAIVIGSDQVWRSWGENWNTSYYFADFAYDKDILILSYAASIGAEHWSFSQEDTRKYAKFIKKYAGVSLRETDSVSIVNDAIGIDSHMNIDPTLLLNKSEYSRIADKEIQWRKGLVAYILDINSEKHNVYNELRKLYDNSTFIQSDLKCHFDNSIRPTPAQWLAIMMNAEGIVTDSFHGTAFAINFNKPFVVMANHFRGQSRLLSVLSLFGLERRMVNTSEEANEIMKEEINWNEVNNKLEIERNRSNNYFSQFNL